MCSREEFREIISGILSRWAVEFRDAMRRIVNGRMVDLHEKNGIWMLQGGTRKITVCSSTFYGVAAKITVHTVKCNGTHCNFSSATLNYPSRFLRVVWTGTRRVRLIEKILG